MKHRFLFATAFELFYCSCALIAAAEATPFGAPEGEIGVDSAEIEIRLV